ncbi:transposase, partial [Lactobacillus crispatus]|uniref:transposase n=1 Tax=Lactobacillus crispatus TaxID=47770 RepID=UPI0015EC7E23
IYGCRKSDVEPIFGHMKSVSGMRRTHLRGKKKVETDVGIMFMTINLKKYGANKKVKPSNFHFKNKKHRNSLKIM